MKKSGFQQFFLGSQKPVLPMKGRVFSPDYRYAFNGKENDRETVGTAEGTQDYGMRIYNPALGRFLSIDPLGARYSMLTPYQFASNQPIWAVDLDGEERSIAIGLEDIDAAPNEKCDYRAALLSKYTSGQIQAFIIESDKTEVHQLTEILKQQSQQDPQGIMFLALFSHGIPGQIFGTNGWPGVNFNNPHALDELETAVKSGDVKFTDGAVIWLGACHAGTESIKFQDKTGNTVETSVAQRIADVTGATVYAVGGAKCGAVDESNGKMVYGRSTIEGNIYAYTAGKDPVLVGSTLDVVELYNRTKMQSFMTPPPDDDSPPTVMPTN